MDRLQDQWTVDHLGRDEISGASRREILFDASALVYRVEIPVMSADTPASSGTANPKTGALVDGTASAYDLGLQPWLAADEVPGRHKKTIPRWVMWIERRNWHPTQPGRFFRRTRNYPNSLIVNTMR